MTDKSTGKHSKSIPLIDRFPSIYKQNIEKWISQGNSIYDVCLLSRGGSEYLIGWNESDVLILQSDHLRIMEKIILCGRKDYEVNLQCSQNSFTLNVMWSENHVVRHLELPFDATLEPALLSVINVLLHKIPYQIDINPDEEITDSIFEHDQFYQFVSCLCDPILDYFQDKRKKLVFTKMGTEYFLGIAVDGITLSIYKGEFNANIFYFLWPVISKASYHARNIIIETIFGNSYILPVSFKNSKTAKNLSDRYFGLIGKFQND